MSESLRSRTGRRCSTRAGFDPSAWKTVAPERNPPVYADARAAWEGTWPNRPDLPVRLEAAALGGKAVYFEAVYPWTRPPRTAPTLLTATERGALVPIFLILGGDDRRRRHLRAAQRARRAWRSSRRFPVVGVRLRRDGRVVVLRRESRRDAVGGRAGRDGALLGAVGGRRSAGLRTWRPNRSSGAVGPRCWSPGRASSQANSAIRWSAAMCSLDARPDGLLAIVGHRRPAPSGVARRGAGRCVPADVLGVAYGVQAAISLLVWRSRRAVMAGLAGVFLLLLLRLALRSQRAAVAAFVLALGRHCGRRRPSISGSRSLTAVILNGGVRPAARARRAVWRPSCSSTSRACSSSSR